MSGPEGRARRTLTEAPADQLLDRLGAELARSYGITRTDLYQVPPWPTRRSTRCTGACSTSRRCCWSWT